MVGYAVYLQRFLEGEPCGVSHHAVEAVLAAHGPVRQDGDRWSLARADLAEAIEFKSHPVTGVSAIAISRPTDAPALRVLIFELLQLGFVFFTQDVDRVCANADRRTHLPPELREAPFVIAVSAEEVWPEAR